MRGLAVAAFLSDQVLLGFLRGEVLFPQSSVYVDLCNYELSYGRSIFFDPILQAES